MSENIENARLKGDIFKQIKPKDIHLLSHSGLTCSISEADTWSPERRDVGQTSSLLSAEDCRCTGR